MNSDNMPQKIPINSDPKSNPLIICLLLNFAAVFCSLGAILLPQYTASPRFYQDSLHDVGNQECQPTGKNWDCTDLQKYRGLLRDTGAVLWQEEPLNLYLKKHPSLWNPYIGSGYPVFLDGIDRKISPSRIWLRNFPSQQGRDILIFFRFFMWSLPFVLIFSLLGVSRFWLFTVGFFSTMIPYVSELKDTIFLDTDMLAPWILFIVLWAEKNKAYVSENYSKSFKTFILLCFSLGLIIGTQSFIQAQITYAVVFGMYLIFYSFLYSKNYLFGLVSFSIPFLLTILPDVFKYLHYLPHLQSSRFAGSCYAREHISWIESLSSAAFSHFGSYMFMHQFTVGGLILIIGHLIQQIKSKNSLVKIPFLIFVLLIFITNEGIPSFICSFSPINGIKFVRHLSPHVQSLFYFLSFSSFFAIRDWFDKRTFFLTLKHSLSFIIFLFAIYPFFKKGFINEAFIKGKLNPEFEFSEIIPKSHSFSAIQKKSIEEDRRHMALDGRLFPNWPSVFEILDSRVLYAFFPKAIYSFYSGVFPAWQNTPPDRFTRPHEGLSQINDDLARLLILDRVSIISHSLQSNWLNHEQNDNLFNKTNCKTLSRDLITQVWICDFIKGISYFPTKVNLSENESVILSEINKTSPNDLINQVWISKEDFYTQFFKNSENKEFPLAGIGKIISFNRNNDELIYELEVENPGFFVISDTWFPGWRASLNNVSTKIYRANLAFKAVFIPESGRFTLKLNFSQIY